MKTDKTVIKALCMISQIGITMLVPILLCGWIGRYLDRHFNSGYFFIIFIILGILAAFRNVYVLTRQFYAKDKAKEDEELNYIANLKKTAKKHTDDV
ncbi:ATP synthase protein I [Lachnospiraceae bacterium KM106-2]|nr:ATP synthase protein I [Lachnospiraceae bacterium KM106-2]